LNSLNWSDEKRKLTRQVSFQFVLQAFQKKTPAGFESQKPASISIWENPAFRNFELAGSKTARLFKSKPRRRPSWLLAPSSHVAAASKVN
jgi:hypothetical protein